MSFTETMHSDPFSSCYSVRYSGHSLGDASAARAVQTMAAQALTNLGDEGVSLAVPGAGGEYSLEHQVEALLELNANLHQEMQLRTTQLQQALDYEASLKRVTDRVRDSLDEHQILQTAVQELATVLGANGCNAALYDFQQGTSTVRYEYTASVPAIQGRVAKMNNAPELYQQLLQGQFFQFCSLTPHPERGRVAMLACPILDDQGVLGDLWIINQKDYGFSELEIRLVQQVVNQCAIAIRQARLYQASQTQVKMLERLNQLKDDFLSTVSHELRTPMTNMKMAIEMLAVLLERNHSYQPDLPPKVQLEDARVMHYLKILKDECQREINLINDLLDLQQFESNAQELTLHPIDLYTWLPQVVEPFYTRTHKRHQSLALQVGEALPILSSNAACLSRILAELLNNACKYTPEGEAIALQVDVVAADLWMTVKNTGVTIAPSELPRIFEKFYRIPNSDPWSQPGTGLGLALVQSLVNRLGGSIRASSDPQATRFTVVLPLHPEDVPLAVPAPMLHAPATPSAQLPLQTLVEPRVSLESV